MTMIAERVAQWLGREGGLTGEQQAVVAYGALTAVNTVVTILLLAAGGLLSGLESLVFTASVTGAAFRVLTGGAHYTAPWRCSGVSALTYVLLAWLASAVGRLPLPVPVLIGGGLFALAAGLWVIAVHAPSDTRAFPLSPEKKARLRRKAVGLALPAGALWIGLALAGASVSLLWAALFAFCWQMFTVTPLGFRAVGAIDLALRRLVDGR